MIFVKKLFNSTILGLALGVLLVGYAVFAFQAPTQAPPAGNVPAPLNTGPSDQTKTGGLLSVFGLWVNQALGVSGGGTFGGIVNLQGNRIINVGSPSLAGDVATKGYADSKAAAPHGKQMFESSGTFTVPAGVTEGWVTIVGGGGGGGSGSASYADWSYDGQRGGDSCFGCGLAIEVRASGGGSGVGGANFTNEGLPGEDSIFGVGGRARGTPAPYGAGGGGGVASHGGSRGGGGGGGGSTILFRKVTSLTPGSRIPVTVGAGGAGGVGYRYDGGPGSSGFVLVEW